MAQEAMLRGLRAIRSLNDPAKFGPWLCGIAGRVCLDWLKCGQARQVSLEAMTDGSADGWFAHPGETPDEAAAKHDDERRLLDEVALLPESYREVILMYYYEDVTYAEVAQVLGVSSATVNARLTKARAMLRERLSGLQR
jgi:RNA polymerase sigma-70 factor (ECF subfamily)